jgi:hypothetical protein
MPALDLGGADPCSLLNITNFPTLWPSEPSIIENMYPALFESPGVLKTYISHLQELKAASPGLNQNILTTTNPTSEFTLIQFLSNGSLAQQELKNPVTGAVNTGIDYSKLGNVILRTEAEVFGIVDSYIVGKRALSKGDTYTFSTDANHIVKDLDIWNPIDSAENGDIITKPASILGSLLKDGFLIKSRELFIPEEFNPSGGYTPAVGDESLVYLYRLAQKGTAYLSPQQQDRKSYLETKNLRFFGAFLAEYCFYRKRYEILLKQYFIVYSQPTTGSGAYAPASGELKLLQIGTVRPVSQQDYLKDLALELAKLNTRLMDLRKLLGKISMYYNTVYANIQRTINNDNAMGSNKDLVNRITALNESTVQAQKYLSDLDFHQGVMEYNSEKNRYGNMLLALYAFLNIAAVAAILQINSSQ